MRFFRKRRRRVAEKQQLDDGFRAIVEKNLLVYPLLDESDRREIEGRIRVLLEEKAFEGCGGLDLTDEHRVTVAAYGALLLLHRDVDYYPRLGSILIYPSAFLAPVRHAVGAAAWIETDEERLGESWDGGALVLSWEDALRDIEDLEGGSNVIIHEFAHQLDEEESFGEGIPALEGRGAFRSWFEVFTREYEAHCDAVDQGRRTLLDEYAAESPAEFFAVVTETFFLLPVDLRMRHPDLYRELSTYYRQDPASWNGRARHA